ncbi:hypothetical protein [Ramlibacter sp.]|uniref:hypothetical protein n=1 Tax=Ramlibacter sp. TaxID=1917967 RepID=UPI002D7F09D9|nr:hypothetical protein [Ramlibacter sp.]
MQVALTTSPRASIGGTAVIPEPSGQDGSVLATLDRMVDACLQRFASHRKAPWPADLLGDFRTVIGRIAHQPSNEYRIDRLGRLVDGLIAPGPTDADAEGRMAFAADVLDGGLAKAVSALQPANPLVTVRRADLLGRIERFRSRALSAVMTQERRDAWLRHFSRLATPDAMGEKYREADLHLMAACVGAGRIPPGVQELFADRSAAFRQSHEQAYLKSVLSQRIRRFMSVIPEIEVGKDMTTQCARRVEMLRLCCARVMADIHAVHASDAVLGAELHRKMVDRLRGELAMPMYSDLTATLTSLIDQHSKDPIGQLPPARARSLPARRGSAAPRAGSAVPKRAGEGSVPHQ